MRLLEGQVALVTGAGGGSRCGSPSRARRSPSSHQKGHPQPYGGAGGAWSGPRIEDSGAGAVVLEADLRDEDACRRLVRKAAAWGGGLTALVNNADVPPTRPLPGMTAAE